MKVFLLFLFFTRINAFSDYEIDNYNGSDLEMRCRAFRKSGDCNHKFLYLKTSLYCCYSNLYNDLLLGDLLWGDWVGGRRGIYHFL